MSFRAARRHTHHELHHRGPPAARRAGLRRPSRAAPPRVARPLLPPARVVRGGRGPRPGGVPARVAPARDVRGLAALMHEDVRFSMPPTPGVWTGRSTVV